MTVLESQLHIAIRKENDTLEKVIDIFCEHSVTSHINVIMVDKDLTEISLLEEKRPYMLTFRFAVFMCLSTSRVEKLSLI